MTRGEARAAFEHAIALHGAYMQAPSAARLPDLRQAIGLYEVVLTVCTERDFPVQWAMTQHNLATAYQELPTGDWGANLAQAMAGYEAALRVYTERAFPVDWAGTQHNLATAYQELPTGDRGANLAQAMACYQAALRVRTEQAFPVQWAMTQNNLASAYADLPTGDRGANLAQAMAGYEAALRVRTPEQLPFDSLQTWRNLGNLYFDTRDWAQALASYTQAVAVSEVIRLAALQETERRRVWQDSWSVVERAVLSAVRTTQYPVALTLAERGKTRNLADHLWRREVKPRDVSEEHWRMYQEYQAQAAAMERHLSGTRPWDRDAPALRERGAPMPAGVTLEDVRELRQRIAESEARFREVDPDHVAFAAPLALPDIAALATTLHAVLVAFRVTQAGTYVFLVGPNDSDVTRTQVVKIRDFSTDTLRQLLVGTADDASPSGWLHLYDRYRRKALSLDAWLACVEQTTRALYDQLLTRVHRRLRRYYPEARRLMLVPNQGLHLLPLHACWWEPAPGERRYLLDDYEMAYTPSCQVLQQCLKREQAHGTPVHSLFAVQNPDSSLDFSDWEVEEICTFFPEDRRSVLAGSHASEAAVKERIRFGTEKLFSCHGHWDLTDVEQSHLVLHGDGKLAVPDIVPMDLRDTWLVVMSACETGLTDVRDIMDDYQGLSAAFLVAGAATVVPSLWAVNDFSTTLLMQRFHANLYERQMAKASALHEAQRWLRDLPIQEVLAILRAKKEALTAASTAQPRSFLQRWFPVRKRPAVAAANLLQQRMSALDLVAVGFSLEDLARASQGKPFANPHWWGAFQCVGAGWYPSVQGE